MGYTGVIMHVFVSLHDTLWCIIIRCVKLAGCLWVLADN